jgi:ribonuclease P protein component
LPATQLGSALRFFSDVFWEQFRLRVGRLLSSKDFERVLTRSSVSRQGHFALHHLAETCYGPAAHGLNATQVLVQQDRKPAALLTQSGFSSTEEISWWLGLVVPKRHARRSVMRSLVKRKIRTSFAQAAHRLPGGMWVVRLTRPFPETVFVSAQSTNLRKCIQLELESLFNFDLELFEKRVTRSSPASQAKS